MSKGNLSLRLLGEGGGPSSYDVVARIEGLRVGSRVENLVVGVA